MRFSQAFIPTLKETPTEAEVVSHRLMLRAGMIRKVAAGIYTLLPNGLKSLRRFEQIVREEMNRAGALEVYMPMVQPAELWKESGRWEQYGRELMRLNDRHKRDFCLGPTHEEVIVDLVRGEVRSYKELPLTLYQIQTKFRDEIRPRFGLMRGREFGMKDAYSFDRNEETSAATYARMFQAYKSIFDRCELEYRAVEADTGNIGGSLSHEFMVLAATGESEIASCSKCDYAANTEKAVDRFEPEKGSAADTAATITRISTPGLKSVDEQCALLKISARRMIKTLVFETTEGPLIALVRGDYDVNPTKLAGVVGTSWIELAGEARIEEVSGANRGFAGPVGLKDPTVRIVADETLRGAVNMTTGANETDAHVSGVNMQRDVTQATYHDIRLVKSDSRCAKCGGGFEFTRGIEVGHTFRLGTKYSEALEATFQDVDGKRQHLVMGCYGIGIGRTVAASIEQNHDAKGIMLPAPLAPYHCTLLSLDPDDSEVAKRADAIYRALQGLGIDTLYDDRKERAGRKFNDADLIGSPLQVIVGKKRLADGQAELKVRRDQQSETVALDAVCDRVREKILER